MPVLIPLRSLRRIERELGRASREFDAHYPTELQDWGGDAPDLETIRNLQTALAWIPGWIGMRERLKRDCYVKAAPPPPLLMP